MAVYSYGGTNVAMSSIDDWHNSYSGQSNLSMNTTFDNLTPADSAPHQLSELRNNAFLYGDVYLSLGASAAGSINVTSGYTAGPFTSTFALKNVNFASISSVTLRANASYPNYVMGWYTAADGGGIELVAGGGGTTSLDITLTSSEHGGYTLTGNTDVQRIYAYFINEHA